MSTKSKKRKTSRTKAKSGNRGFAKKRASRTVRKAAAHNLAGSTTGFLDLAKMAPAMRVRVLNAINVTHRKGKRRKVRSAGY